MILLQVATLGGSTERDDGTPTIQIFPRMCPHILIYRMCVRVFSLRDQ